MEDEEEELQRPLRARVSSAGGEKTVVAMEEELQHAASLYVRLASRADVPHVLALIRLLSEYERLSEMCVASESRLEATLFKLAPFQGPTVFLLEVGRSGAWAASVPEAPAVATDGSVDFEQVACRLALDSAVEDPQAGVFASCHDADRIVVGFVLFFPNYSTFLSQPGFYIEDLFVRECYRGRGFGTILLKAVAQMAVKLDYGRVEWSVLDWNENAIKFYEGIGAKVLPEWRICRLTGENLKACGS